MGSWNSTCGLSSTAVISGTKVKTVIIKNAYKMPEASGFCYNGSLAKPISFAFDAVYNDYGTVDEIQEGEATRLFLEFFTNKLARGKIKVTPDKYYDEEDFGDEEPDYSSLDIESLLKIIERDRVYILDDYYDDGMKQGWVNIGISMYNTTIFESVRDSIFESSDWESSDYTKENIEKDVNFAIDDMFKSPIISKFIQETLDECNEIITNSESSEEEIQEAKAEMVSYKKFAFKDSKYWENDEIRKSGDWSNKVRILGSREDVDTTTFRDFYSSIKENYNDNNRYEYIEMLSDMIMLINVMVSLRRAWAPQPGKGSQSFDEDAYEGLANGIMKVIYEQRDDLADYELSCTEDFTAYYAGSGYNFKKGTQYYCQKMEKDNLLLGNGCWITYKQFQKYFEY